MNPATLRLVESVRRILLGFAFLQVALLIVWAGWCWFGSHDPKDLRTAWSSEGVTSLVTGVLLAVAYLIVAILLPYPKESEQVGLLVFWGMQAPVGIILSLAFIFDRETAPTSPVWMLLYGGLMGGVSFIALSSPRKSQAKNTSR